MVFARRLRRIQRAIVEIGDASSGFLQFVAMAFRLLPYAPRTQIRYMVGCAYPVVVIY
ncbi:MAG TPA: hypothetical protein VGG99_29520 [Acetobacteraceae bacterium]